MAYIRVIQISFSMFVFWLSLYGVEHFPFGAQETFLSGKGGGIIMCKSSQLFLPAGATFFNQGPRGFHTIYLLGNHSSFPYLLSGNVTYGQLGIGGTYPSVNIQYHNFTVNYIHQEAESILTFCEPQNAISHRLIYYNVSGDCGNQVNFNIISPQIKGDFIGNVNCFIWEGNSSSRTNNGSNTVIDQ